MSDALLSPVNATDISLDPRFGVDFATAPIAGARILWLNSRWFAEEGFDVGDPHVAAGLKQWLLRHFGVIADDWTTAGSTLFADRYGGTHGIVHGGSGRAGSRDGFNAKGIGRTPLVGTRTDFHHTHGSLWLYEAVREIIASEIASAELPRGAVPIVALIDTGQDLRFPDQLVRRAIIVRPDFIRPAIFERSVFFGTSGTPGSDQVLDAKRVRTAIEAAAIQAPPFGANVSIEAIFEGIATQLGAARALRLWQGHFTSSNVAIDGAWADFGAFCAMPDWRRAERGFGARFGADEHLIHNTVRSICFYWGKYGRLADPRREAARIVKKFGSWVSKSFDQTLVRELRLARLMGEDLVHAIIELLNRYYAEQQRQDRVYEISPRGGWILDDIDPEDAAESKHGSDYRYRLAFWQLFHGGGLEQAKAALARRIFSERPSLYPTAADLAFKGYVNPTGDAFRHTPQSIQGYIDHSIGKSRRAWPAVEDRYVVLAQWCRAATTILLVADLDRGGERRWLLQSVVRDGRIRAAFGDMPFQLFESYEIGIRKGLIARFDLPYASISVDRANLSLADRHYELGGEFINWMEPEPECPEVNVAATSVPSLPDE